MRQSLKSNFSHVERAVAKALPPEVMAYMLPIRFRHIHHYFPKEKIMDPESRQKAFRYFDRICARRKDIGEVFALDVESRQSGREGPLTSALSDGTLRSLLAQPQARLSDPANVLNQCGRFRMAAVFRALLLLRSAMDNIASGQDQSGQHDMILLEIAENDFCQAVLERPDVIKGAVREKLFQQLKEASDWNLSRMISAFVKDDSGSPQASAAPLRGKSVMLQGPSNRPSNLADTVTDLTAVVGYAGPDSLVRPVDRVDVSLYVVPKLQQLHEQDRLYVLKDVGLPVFSCVNESNQNFCNNTLGDHEHACYNLQFANLGSKTNGGVRLFLWLIGAGASKVFVTNFDMFTNRDLPSGFISDRAENQRERSANTFRVKKETMAADFAKHQPSQQYAIYKCFGKYDGIVYDSVLTNPLSAYIDELEGIYDDEH